MLEMRVKLEQYKGHLLPKLPSDEESGAHFGILVGYS